MFIHINHEEVMQLHTETRMEWVPLLNACSTKHMASPN